jgi:hypothetical protein
LRDRPGHSGTGEAIGTGGQALPQQVPRVPPPGSSFPGNHACTVTIPADAGFPNPRSARPRAPTASETAYAARRKVERTAWQPATSSMLVRTSLAWSTPCTRDYGRPSRSPMTSRPGGYTSICAGTCGSRRRTTRTRPGWRYSRPRQQTAGTQCAGGLFSWSPILSGTIGREGVRARCGVPLPA